MEIVILTIIILVLTVILFYALRRLIASITMDSKDYYLKRMQDYDDEILSKAKELELMGRIDSPVDEPKNKEETPKNEIFDKELINIINDTEYSSENALKLANKVDEIFNIDEEKIIKDFVSNMEVDENYKVYQSLYDRFSPNIIYKLKMIDKDSQVREIGKMIPDDEFEVFNSYINTHKFKLDRFLVDLSLLIERSRPNIEVLVGNKNKNYDSLSPYIKTIYDEDIYKGIIIKYQDQIYDYSINERDV